MAIELDDRFLRRKPRIEFDRLYLAERKGFKQGIIVGAGIVFVIYTIFLILIR